MLRACQIFFISKIIGRRLALNHSPYGEYVSVKARFLPFWPFPASPKGVFRVGPPRSLGYLRKSKASGTITPEAFCISIDRAYQGGRSYSLSSGNTHTGSSPKPSALSLRCSGFTPGSPPDSR